MSGTLRLSSRLVIGATAGFVGTIAMTAAMRRMHARLPTHERYPLTPREIIDAGAEAQPIPMSDAAAKDLTMAGHFGYGALAGALLGAVNPRMRAVPGAAAGVAVWLASYMGWIPGVGLLKPASGHPPRRNALMIVAHLVWGAAVSVTMRELIATRSTIFARGRGRDVQPNRAR